MPIKPGRQRRPCGFYGEPSWAGRGDLAENFLCEPCVKKAEALITPSSDELVNCYDRPRYHFQLMSQFVACIHYSCQ